MIIRSCFVSNSSSASFIVLGNSSDRVKRISKNPSRKGDVIFEYGTYMYPEDRINFLFEQVFFYHDEDEELKENVKNFCLKHKIDFDNYYQIMMKKMERETAYINHESILWKNEGVYEDYFGIYDILSNPEKIEDFVLNPNTKFIMERD